MTENEVTSPPASNGAGDDLVVQAQVRYLVDRKRPVRELELSPNTRLLAVAHDEDQARARVERHVRSDSLAGETVVCAGVNVGCQDQGTACRDVEARLPVQIVLAGYGTG